MALGSTLRFDGEGTQDLRGLTSITNTVSIENPGPGRLVIFAAPFSIAGTGTFTAFAGDGDLALQFLEGATYELTGTASMSVVADAPHRIFLSDGSANPVQWTLEVDATASYSFDRVHLTGCAAAGTAAPLTASDSLDGGSNTNWLFP